MKCSSLDYTWYAICLLCPTSITAVWCACDKVYSHYIIRKMYKRIECNGFMALCIVWSNIIAGEYTLVNIIEIYLPRDFGSFFLVSYYNCKWSAVTDESVIYQIDILIFIYDI